MASDVLICGTNWLGDNIMSMPAVEELRRRSPARRVAVLVKAKWAALWSMQPAVDDVIPYSGTALGTVSAGLSLRAARWREAFVFPNSLRSALIPFLARVPSRSGAAGHGRSWLLTRVVDTAPAGGLRHQAWEYFRILGVGHGVTAVPAPSLTMPPAAIAAARRATVDVHPGPWVGLFPGAARGPSKRWPRDRFVAVGRALAAKTGCRVAVLGAASESVLCLSVAEGIGAAGESMAGKTDIVRLAALLRQCGVAIGNDSGGMHLAAAVGTPTVGIFGVTDASRTAPLGSRHRSVVAAGVACGRDVARDCAEGTAALRSIEPARVVAEALAAMELDNPDVRGVTVRIGEVAQRVARK